MQASLNGRQIKNPAIRAMFAIVGVLIAAGIIGVLVLVALPLAALALGVAVVGGLAAAFVPRLRRRNSPPRSPLPRKQGGMKSVEPDAPPRTLE
ncbi:MAG: hypothetical protein SynsKO_40260 [Synoicihabitans sp.]